MREGEPVVAPIVIVCAGGSTPAGALKTTVEVDAFSFGPPAVSAGTTVSVTGMSTWFEIVCASSRRPAKPPAAASAAVRAVSVTFALAPDARSSAAGLASKKSPCWRTETWADEPPTFFTPIVAVGGVAPTLALHATEVVVAVSAGGEPRTPSGTMFDGGPTVPHPCTARTQT